MYEYLARERFPYMGIYVRVQGDRNYENVWHGHGAVGGGQSGISRNSVYSLHSRSYAIRGRVKTGHRAEVCIAHIAQPARTRVIRYARATAPLWRSSALQLVGRAHRIAGWDQLSRIASYGAHRPTALHATAAPVKNTPAGCTTVPIPRHCL